MLRFGKLRQRGLVLLWRASGVVWCGVTNGSGQKYKLVAERNVGEEMEGKTEVGDIIDGSQSCRNGRRSCSTKI